MPLCSFGRNNPVQFNDKCFVKTKWVSDANVHAQPMHCCTCKPLRRLGDEICGRATNILGHWGGAAVCNAPYMWHWGDERRKSRLIYVTLGHDELMYVRVRVNVLIGSCIAFMPGCNTIQPCYFPIVVKYTWTIHLSTIPRFIYNSLVADPEDRTLPQAC